MTIFSLILIILSNSVSSRKDLSILFTRSVLITYFLPCYLIIDSFNDLYYGCDSGIGIYGGLFFVSPISHTFHSILYIITSIILILTGFYPSISPKNLLDYRKYDFKNNNDKNILNNSEVTCIPFIIIFLYFIYYVTPELEIDVDVKFLYSIMPISTVLKKDNHSEMDDILSDTIELRDGYNIIESEYIERVETILEQSIQIREGSNFIYYQDNLNPTNLVESLQVIDESNLTCYEENIKTTYTDNISEEYSFEDSSSTTSPLDIIDDTFSSKDEYHQKLIEATNPLPFTSNEGLNLYDSFYNNEWLNTFGDIFKLGVESLVMPDIHWIGVIASLWSILIHRNVYWPNYPQNNIVVYSANNITPDNLGTRNYNNENNNIVATNGRAPNSLTVRERDLINLHRSNLNITHRQEIINPNPNININHPNQAIGPNPNFNLNLPSINQNILQNLNFNVNLPSINQNLHQNPNLNVNHLNQITYPNINMNVNLPNINTGQVMHPNNNINVTLPNQNIVQPINNNEINPHLFTRLWNSNHQVTVVTNNFINSMQYSRQIAMNPIVINDHYLERGNRYINFNSQFLEDLSSELFNRWYLHISGRYRIPVQASLFADIDLAYYALEVLRIRDYDYYRRVLTSRSSHPTEFNIDSVRWGQLDFDLYFVHLFRPERLMYLSPRQYRNHMLRENRHRP